MDDLDFVLRFIESILISINIQAAIYFALLHLLPTLYKKLNICINCLEIDLKQTESFKNNTHTAK